MCQLLCHPFSGEGLVPLVLHTTVYMCLDTVYICLDIIPLAMLYDVDCCTETPVLVALLVFGMGHYVGMCKLGSAAILKRTVKHHTV